MTILTIARMGHPVLRRQAEPVTDLTDPQLARLIADMRETMEDAPGVGLAAPQVRAGLRLVIFRVPPGRGDNPDPGVPETVLINPEIEPLGDETALGWEACLSVPGLRALVPRWTRIRYRGLAPDGTKIEREASGFHARVVQHECDHLDGRLYLDRLPDLRLLTYDEEVAAFSADLLEADDEDDHPSEDA
jgi:peptide deformylase